MKHLPGQSRVALGHWDIRPPLMFLVISIGPGGRRQPSAPTAYESGFFRHGEPRLERPIGDSSGRRACVTQYRQTLVFERVGHDGFQDSA